MVGACESTELGRPQLWRCFHSEDLNVTLLRLNWKFFSRDLKLAARKDSSSLAFFIFHFEHFYLWHCNDLSGSIHTMAYYAAKNCHLCPEKNILLSEQPSLAHIIRSL